MWTVDLADIVRRINAIPCEDEVDFVPTTSKLNLRTDPYASALVGFRAEGDAEIRGATAPKMSVGHFEDMTQKKRKRAVRAKRAGSPEVPIAGRQLMRTLSDRGYTSAERELRIQSMPTETIPWLADVSLELSDGDADKLTGTDISSRSLEAMVLEPKSFDSNISIDEVKQSLEKLSIEKETLGTKLEKAESTSDQYAKENEQLKKELEELKEANKVQEEAIKEQKVTIEDQEQRIECLVARQDDKDEGLEELRATSSSTIRELQQRIADLEEEVVEAQEEGKRVVKEYEQASEEVIEEMEASIGQNQIKLAQQQTKITQQGVQLSDMQIRIARKEATIAQQEGTIAEQDSKLEIANARIAQLEGIVEELKAAAVRIQEERSKLREEAVREASKDCKALSEKYAAEKEYWEQQLRDSKNEVDTAKRAHGVCEEQLDELTLKHEAAQKEHAEAVQDFEHLCCALRNDLNVQLAQQQASTDQDIAVLKDQIHKKDIAMRRMQEDHEAKVADFENLRSVLVSEMNLQLSNIQATKDKEIVDLTQRLKDGEAAMQALQAECETKLSEKCVEMAKLQEEAAQEREALLQECQSAEARVAEECAGRAAEKEARTKEVAELREAIKERDARLQEIEEEQVTMLSALGDNMANQRLYIQDLAKKYLGELIALEEQNATEIADIIRHVNK
eukprot:evm.model.scf_265.4 EVM.evm.TU.scf_265.4   scf_265:72637-77929(-)